MLPPGDVGQGVANWRTWSVHRELEELGLFHRELIGAPATRTQRLDIALFNTNAAEMALKDGGALLYNLLGLDAVDDADLRDVFDRYVSPEGDQ
jgi:hypothetical protein